MKPFNFIILFIVIFHFTGCAPRQDVITLDKRLSALENRYSDVKNLKKDSDKKTRKLRSKSASMGVKLREIQEEMQALKGTLEEIEFQIGKIKKAGENSNQLLIARFDRLENQVKVNQEHINNLEKYLDFNPEDIKTSTELKNTLKSEKTDHLDEEALYNAARLSFEKGSFDTARDLFQQLIKKYPKSKDADNAQFWIGEIYYRNKMFKEAIVEYQKVIENYPSGNKVKASLLKQGYAFYNLGNKKLARKLFKELIKKYPTSSQARFAKKKLKSL